MTHFRTTDIISSFIAGMTRQMDCGSHPDRRSIFQEIIQINNRGKVIHSGGLCLYSGVSMVSIMISMVANCLSVS